MRRLLLISLGLILLAPAIMKAQNDQAIGLRMGGGNTVGAEISYQTPFDGNRLELDLGWGGNANWHYWKLTGLYQWVMPIESGFYWYLGVGPSIGNWSYVGKDLTRNGGLSLSAALNAGIEYTFNEVPIQISIDTRPEIEFINRGGSSFFGLALAVRYKF